MKRFTCTSQYFAACQEALLVVVSYSPCRATSLCGDAMGHCTFPTCFSEEFKGQQGVFIAAAGEA